ncbi:MAG: pentapeptide repeat-containing protein [Anaerolineales bacterium]|nr:pentapeptide repeat-containing protein [Anaerolineales bacterium]
MANHSHTNVQHNQFLRNRNNYRTRLQDREAASSEAVVISAKVPLSVVLKNLRNADHDIVLQAVRELRARGCLNDNTLPWICLRYANLQGADLSTANLQNADLHKANLELTNLSYSNLNYARLTRTKLQSTNLDKASWDGANLIGANLKGAKNVSHEQLAQAGRMRACILPDGNLYDGRFNLPGDFADASILHVDLNNPAAIAAFYGVSLEEFLHGQEWRQEHMPAISAWHKSVGFQNAELIMSWF